MLGMKMHIINADTGEYLGAVTTRYSNIEALFSNVQRWMKRHPGYKYVGLDELKSKGLEWSGNIYYVKEV